MWSCSTPAPFLPILDAGFDAGRDSANPDIPIMIDAGPELVVLSFDPSNLGGLAHAQTLRGDGHDDVVADDDCERLLFGTNAGEITPTSCGVEATFIVIEQPGAPPPADTVGVFFLRNLTVQEGAVLSVAGTRPAIIVATERIDIDGSVLVGAGLWGGGEGTGGYGPGGGGLHEGRFFSSGTGGSHCSSGGAGFEASAVTNGPVYGDRTLTPLMGGSGGGGADDPIGARGGTGGGALQFVAGQEIRIGSQGTIDARGTSGSGLSYGSGGGSGGAILLEAPSIVINGQLLAGGGNGGQRNGGGTGAEDSSEATSGVSGGAGRAGGGGGGFGYLRFNSNATVPPIAIDAYVSPNPGHRCTTVGSLAPRTSPPSPPDPPEACPVSAGEGGCAGCTEARCCDVLMACERDTLCATCRNSDSPGPRCQGYEPLDAIAACVSRLCTTCR